MERFVTRFEEWKAAGVVPATDLAELKEWGRRGFFPKPQLDELVARSLLDKADRDLMEAQARHKLEPVLAIGTAIFRNQRIDRETLQSADSFSFWPWGLEAGTNVVPEGATWGWYEAVAKWGKGSDASSVVETLRQGDRYLVIKGPGGENYSISRTDVVEDGDFYYDSRDPARSVGDRLELATWDVVKNPGTPSQKTEKTLIHIPYPKEIRGVVLPASFHFGDYRLLIQFEDANRAWDDLETDTRDGALDPGKWIKAPGPFASSPRDFKVRSLALHLVAQVAFMVSPLVTSFFSNGRVSLCHRLLKASSGDLNRKEALDGMEMFSPIVGDVIPYTLEQWLAVKAHAIDPVGYQGYVDEAVAYLQSRSVAPDGSRDGLAFVLEQAQKVLGAANAQTWADLVRVSPYEVALQIYEEQVLQIPAGVTVTDWRDAVRAHDVAPLLVGVATGTTVQLGKNGPEVDPRLVVIPNEVNGWDTSKSPAAHYQVFVGTINDILRTYARTKDNEKLDEALDKAKLPAGAEAIVTEMASMVKSVPGRGFVRGLVIGDTEIPLLKIKIDRAKFLFLIYGILMNILGMAGSGTVRPGLILALVFVGLSLVRDVFRAITKGKIAQAPWWKLGFVALALMVVLGGSPFLGWAVLPLVLYFVVADYVKLQFVRNDKFTTWILLVVMISMWVGVIGLCGGSIHVTNPFSLEGAKAWWEMFFPPTVATPVPGIESGPVATPQTYFVR
ncbi:MAG: hypothetical protein ABII16_03565 [Patescibacteria group bacterium]